MQYRSNFLVEGVMSVAWLTWTLAPLLFVFEHTSALAGWTYDEAMLVTGFFVVLEGLLQAVIDPNLRGIVEHIREGTLDFLLLKPHDAQLLVSFSRTVPAKLLNVAAGLALVAVAAEHLPTAVTFGDIALAIAVLLAGAASLYGLWLAVVSSAFWFVRIDNLSYLIASLVEAGRWPITTYRGIVRFILTFVIPVGLMTTYPALALRGMLSPAIAAEALAIACGFLFVGRVVWKFALRHYGSASS